MQRINPLILKAGSIINHISDDRNKEMDNIEIFIKFKNYKKESLMIEKARLIGVFRKSNGS